MYLQKLGNFFRNSSSYFSLQKNLFSGPFFIRKCNISSFKDHDNLKRIQLTKKLVSTVLFGSVLLVAVWCKKRRKLAVFDESTLVKADFYKGNQKFYNYRGFVLPVYVMNCMEKLQAFACRETDIYVMSFPKTGTTWLQEIVYCIMKDSIADSSKMQSIEERFPYLEFVYPGLAAIEKVEGQRFIKTHIPFSLLPPDIHQKQPKILYIMRNPRDVTVSYFHFLRMFTMSSYVGDFNQFVNDMIDDKVPYGPMWKHYYDMWQHRDENNILILFYEDLHKDIRGSIKKIADFLGKPLTEESILQIAEHCSFEKMSHNPEVNYDYWDDIGLRHKNESKFMRKGEVGDWQHYFTQELNDKMDRWIDMNLKNISFTYLPNDENPLTKLSV